MNKQQTTKVNKPTNPRPKGKGKRRETLLEIITYSKVLTDAAPGERLMQLR